MTINSIHVLHGLDTAAVFYSQLEQAALSAGIENRSVIPSGYTQPLFVGGQEDKPEVSLATHQVAALIAQCGLFGAQLANADLYYRKVAAFSARVAPATTEHIRLRAPVAYLYLESLSAGHHTPASAMAKLILLTDGANPGLIPAGTVALAGTPAAAENFVLGPCVINVGDGDVVLDGADNLSLSLNPQPIVHGSGSNTFREFAAMQSVSPVITLTTTRTSAWHTLHKKALTVTGDYTGGIRFQLRRRSPDGDNVPNGTAQHVALTATHGRVVCTQVDNGADGARTTLQITLRAPDVSTNALTFAVNTTIALTI